MAAPRWGLSSTVKASVDDILCFAAYHLERGAHRLYLYLDDPQCASYAPLKAHPKVRVRRCDAAWWSKQTGKRPVKHQVRQALNATHAYNRPAEVDWLIHMDVDEFLWPDTDVADTLAALPADILTARVRPAEALAGSTQSFKAFLPTGPNRARIVGRLYPTFGTYLRGGFVSHTAGKLFARTGQGTWTIRIHNAFHGDEMNPGETDLPDIALLHCHAKDWTEWLALYRFRLDQGSYRADLPAARPADKGGMTLHELFRWLESKEGEAGLRAFYDEVLSDAEGLPERLRSEGLLRHHNLQLTQLRQKHFPV